VTLIFISGLALLVPALAAWLQREPMHIVASESLAGIRIGKSEFNRMAILPSTPKGRGIRS
jgi:hypothetical protein